MIELGTDKIILPDGCVLFPCFKYYAAGANNVNVIDDTGKVFNLNPDNTLLADQQAILDFLEAANVALCAAGGGGAGGTEGGVGLSFLEACLNGDKVTFEVCKDADSVISYVGSDGSSFASFALLVAAGYTFDCTEGAPEVLCRPWVDDVNGDGTLLVPYSEAYCLEKNDTGGVDVVSLGFYTDRFYTTQYAIQGTPTDPNTIGSEPQSRLGFLYIYPDALQGPTAFTPSPNIVGVSWFVEGPTNTDGSFNFSSGATICDLTKSPGQVGYEIPIPNGHSAEWGIDLPMDATKQIKAGTARIIITTVSKV